MTAPEKREGRRKRSRLWFFDTPAQEARLALRLMRRSPIFTAAAVISLALGIGANAAIFSLYDETLLKALPVADPQELVNLSAPGPKPGMQSNNNAGRTEDTFSYPMFRDLERVQTVFTGIAAHRILVVNLAFQGETMNGRGMAVSGGYFGVLGLKPALGRLIDDSDDRKLGESPVVVLSNDYWRTRFGSDPNILNERLMVNGVPMTIVGVAPRGFTGTTLGTKPQIFVPITMHGALNPDFVRFDDRRCYWLYLFARLKPGVSLEQARIVLDGQYHAIVNEVEVPLQEGMSDTTTKQFKGKKIVLAPGARGQSQVHSQLKTPMSLLLGVTALVLLIACANIANLQLARAATRKGEMAVRLSIGAGRWQLVRQLLTESCLLAVFGGLAGLLIARWTLGGIASLLPAETAADFRFALDTRGILFAAGLTIATGFLFGLFPALDGTRTDLASTLKGQAGQPSGARTAARFRTSLAVSQIALAMALLVSAGLFTRSLLNISRIDLGIRADNVVKFAVYPQLNGYTAERSRALFERIEEELAALPGVTRITSSMVPILVGDSWGNTVSVEGFEAGPDTNTVSMFNEIGPDYFRTLGVPLLAGREFTRADSTGTPKVAIVNMEFARKFHLGRDAVGKRMANGRTDKLDIEIVGLVPDTKYNDVKSDPPPLFFRPYRQDKNLGWLSFYVRTAIDPQKIMASIPSTIARLDPNLPVVDLSSLPAQVRESVFLDRTLTVLSAAFAALATLLAAVGLYGVLAYTVAQRTREIGLRMALGAGPGAVRFMILKQVAWMVLAGGVVGLLAAAALGRAAQSLLFGLGGHDPLVFAVSSLALGVVAFGAGLIPALRASRVDPMHALRYE